MMSGLGNVDFTGHRKSLWVNTNQKVINNLVYPSTVLIIKNTGDIKKVMNWMEEHPDDTFISYQWV